MTHLTMVFGNEALLNKIVSKSTSEWPSGLAFGLVALIKKRNVRQRTNWMESKGQES